MHFPSICFHLLSGVFLYIGTWEDDGGSGDGFFSEGSSMWELGCIGWHARVDDREMGRPVHDDSDL